MLQYKKTWKNIEAYFAAKHSKEYPRTPIDLYLYFDLYGELPFATLYPLSRYWLYEAWQAYYKTHKVRWGQDFCPPIVAQTIGKLATNYFDHKKPVLDACCGFGMLGRGLTDKGFRDIYGFDVDEKMGHVFFSFTHGGTFLHTTMEDFQPTKKYSQIVCYPPQTKEGCTTMLYHLGRFWLEDGGVAICLLPFRFSERRYPKRLGTALQQFTLLHLKTVVMGEILKEIVVLKKISNN